MKYIDKSAKIIESDIGDFSTIGESTKIFYSKIGKFCSISWNVTVGATNHTIETISTHNFPFTTFWELSDEYNIKRIKTIIGNDVWLGVNVVVIAGIKIGDGVIIGANSVVTKDLEDYGVYAGNPAKLIKKRFPEETIKILKEIKWWNFDKDFIKKNIDFFKKEKILKDDLLRLKELNEKFSYI